jgi:hypothetical protein
MSDKINTIEAHIEVAGAGKSTHSSDLANQSRQRKNFWSGPRLARGPALFLMVALSLGLWGCLAILWHALRP